MNSNSPMNVELYEHEMRQGLIDAIDQLARIDGLVIHAFNAWTDPSSGISEFSADTRDNSDRVVRQMQEWQEATAKTLDQIGRPTWKAAVLRPCLRNDNPAEFKYRGVVRLQHEAWNNEMDENRWPLIQPILVRIRDEAVELIRGRLKCETDAQVSIGTERDWNDLPRLVMGA